MKHKITMIIAMLAVMVAMTGTAMADYSVHIVKSPLQIGGSGDESTLTYGDLVSGNTFYTVRTNNPQIYVKACISQCTDYPSATSTGWVNSQTFLTSGFYTSSPDAVTIYAKGTVEGKVFVHINSGTSAVLNGIGGDEDEAQATVRTLIPEFTTVAVPIGATIGLMFLFYRRKNKKE